MTVGDLREALVDAPADALIYIDDFLIDSIGSKRTTMLSVLSAKLSEPYALGSPDGPMCRDFVIVVEDSDYALVGKPVTT